MIKRLILATLLALASTAFAAEKITLIWGFSPASNQANFYRAIVAKLNQQQSKYEFIFDTKPGAGGAIGARYVLANPQTTLLGGTSTFFIRPNFDKETGYQADQFQSDKIVCIDDQNPYFRMMHDSWGQKLREVFDGIEDPMWHGEQTQNPLMQPAQKVQVLKKILTPEDKLI